MTLSPYASPPEATDNREQPGRDDDPMDDPRVVVWILRITTLLLIPLGYLGSIGVFVMLFTAADNPEASEVIIAPVYAWLFSIPFVIACLLMYRKCCAALSAVDKLWVMVWCLLPTIALLVAIVVSVVRF